MHSRIYTVSKAPVDSDYSVFSSEDLYDAINCADSVNDSEYSQQEDINDLADMKIGSIEGNKWTITIDDARKYFAKKYEKFLELSSNATLDDFMNSSFKYNIENTFEDKGGFYIASNFSGVETIDEFLRNNIGVFYTGIFYIGKVYDYHW